MAERGKLGGIIHTYQKYDARRFPSPTQPPPDVVSPAFEHMLAFGDYRQLTPEELANAVHLDPSQIAGLGPSLEALKAMLEARKRKILEQYETDSVQQKAESMYRHAAERIEPPKNLRRQYEQAAREQQIRDLERLYYQHGDDTSRFSRQLVQLVEHLGNLYDVDELAAKYEFTGRTPLNIEQALEVKQELEQIDELLKQLEEAAKNAQIGIIDMEALSEFAEPGDIEQLEGLQRQVAEYLKQLAEQQGLEQTSRGMTLTPKAYRLFQSKLLEQIFSQLQASRTGRHQGPIVGEGAVEMQQTKPYEFGDSVMNMDLAQSLINAMIRTAGEHRDVAAGREPLRLKADDIEIHRTRNNPKCATVVIMDMSGSMRHGGQYIHVKRMALALEGLIRKEYPGDFLQFIEMYSFAKPRASGEIVTLMPKPVSIFDPVVRFRADMSDPNVTEFQVPQHFTNIQHALEQARRFLVRQDTPNKQVILITDGLPTAHFEGQLLYLLYPPHPRTEEATMREGQACRRDGVTLNIFLMPSWSQSSEDIQFAYRLAESTKGRVFFTAGSDLDRYVVWDYVNRRRTILG